MNILTASHQWATRPADQRFQTLADLRASVHGRRLRSRSVDLDMSQVTAHADDGALVINSAITPCEPSHWALTQFAGMLGAPAVYLRTLPAPLLVDCLNHGLQKRTPSDVKFMTVTRDDQDDNAQVNTLQAVTSPTYGRIWDADCVDAVQRIVERTNGKFYNPKAYSPSTGDEVPSGLYASDRDVFMFMIDGGSRLDIGPRAQLNRGFIVWNSEVGARTFGLMTFLFNEVCGNHIIWGAQQVNSLVIRHTKNGPYRFDAEAAPALLAYVQSSAAAEESTIRNAQRLLVPVGMDDLATYLDKSPAKFTRAEVREAIASAEREEGKCSTLWDVVQGFTAYARGFDFVDARVDLEKRAGALLKMAVTE
jgi:hypothetical protein